MQGRTGSCLSLLLLATLVATASRRPSEHNPPVRAPATHQLAGWVIWGCCLSVLLLATLVWEELPSTTAGRRPSKHNRSLCVCPSNTAVRKQGHMCCCVSLLLRATLV
jgi:hypothetical protein